MNTTRADIRNSLVCGAVALAALLLAWPFANLSFNDDWTWALTVLRLSQTGHLIYNGWSSPSVIGQAYWGLLWVKAFGFSFNVLRVSMLPASIGATAVCYLLARRAGLTASTSIFASLLLGLSPVYMPLECTFMTDAPGLFFMLVSTYALLCGYAAQDKKQIVFWLTLGAVSALVGGSNRQLVWIVPLVVLPYLAWLRRGDRLYVVLSLLGWLVVFGGAVAIQHWYSRQPYALPDPPLLSYLKVARHYPRQSVIGVICVLLTLVMLLLPAVVGAVRFRVGAAEATAAILFVAIYLILRRLHHATEPWMGNIITSSGPLGSIEIGGGTPVVLGHYSRLILSMAVIAGCSLLLGQLVCFLWTRSKTAIAQMHALLNPTAEQAAVVCMLLISLAMFALELTRVVSQVSYDRHLLPFIPFVVIPLLFAFQQQGLRRMPIGSWAVLIVYAAYAIASTQEVNALARGRARSIAKLEAAGVNANQIDAGFEHDYWTEAVIDGYINDPRIENPKGAYDLDKGPTPGMKIAYRLESSRTSATATTVFGSTLYFSLLPPFHRTIYIDRFIDPWWLDPAKAATRPAGKSLLPKILLDQYQSK